jgi:hypothetical protein
MGRRRGTSPQGGYKVKICPSGADRKAANEETINRGAAIVSKRAKNRERARGNEPPAFFCKWVLTFLCGHIIISLYPQGKEAKLLGIKKGTKLTDSPKDKVLKVRIDTETERRLTLICEQSAKTKSEVVREGIDRQYNDLQHKEDT